MSTEQNRVTFRRLIEESFNKGDLSAPDERFAASFREHEDDILPLNLEGVKDAMAGCGCLNSKDGSYCFWVDRR